MTPGMILRKLRSAIRRVRVRGSSGGLWRLTGHGDETVEQVEVFGGVGFHSRPGSSGKPEAIVVKVGAASGHPVIIATRDESVRVSLEEDETAIFNSQALVLVKADGTIEARSTSGSAAELALKSDVEALRDYLKDQFSTTDGHTHASLGAPPTPGGGASPGVGFTFPDPAGTTKLKGE